MNEKMFYIVLVLALVMALATVFMLSAGSPLEAMTTGGVIAVP